MPQTYEGLIVLLALAGLGIAGLRAARANKGRTTGEYFLAGKSIGWLVLGLSLFVTTLWGMWSFSVGLQITPGLLGWVLAGAIASVGLVLLGVVFAPLYRTSEAATIPGLLGERYGERVRSGVAIVLILLTLFVQIPLTILVGTRLLHALLGWDLMSSALLMIVVPGLSVVAGGYHAVMAVQGVGGIATGAGLFLLALNGFHAGTPFASRMPAEPGISLLPLLAGLILIGSWCTCFDQCVVQRGFAAKSNGAVRAGTSLAAVLVVFGVAALAVVFDSGSSTTKLLADGNSIAAGLVGAAIIASGISSLSGHFMSVATLFTLDLFPGDRKRTGEAAMVLAGRLTAIVVVIVAIVAASSLIFAGAHSIEWMARGITVVVPPLVAVIAVGFLWPRMHGHGALWGLGLGWATGLIQVIVIRQGFVELMQSAVVTFVCSSLAFVVLSLVFAPLESSRWISDIRSAQNNVGTYSRTTPNSNS